MFSLNWKTLLWMCQVVMVCVKNSIQSETILTTAATPIEDQTTEGKLSTRSDLEFVKNVLKQAAINVDKLANITETRSDHSFSLVTEDDLEGNAWVEDETAMVTSMPTADFFDTLEFLQEKAKEGMDEIVRRLLPLAVRIHAEVDISSPCISSFLDFLDALRKFRGWALRMIDASGKIPEGVLNGALTSFGSYDECVDVTTANDEDQEMIRGQYCAIDIQPPLPRSADRAYVESKLRNMTDFRRLLKETKTDEIGVFVDFIRIRLGLCLPSECTRSDIAGVTEYVSKEMKINATLKWCEVKKPFEPDAVQLAILCGLAFFISLLLLGTLAERIPIILRRINMLPSKEPVKVRESGFFLECIESFSMFRNFKSLLGGQAFNENLRAVHGLRFVTLLWIVLANTYFGLNFRSVSGLANARFVGENLLFQIVLNASLAGETFFFISGFLIAFRTCVSMEEKKGRFSIVSFYARRYWRVTPPYLLVICLFLVTTNLGNGPIWRETVGPMDDNCRTNWWYNALYLGNYLHPTQMCLPHTWFLAAEMQLVFVAPMLIVFLYRWPIVGRALIAILVSAAMVATGLVTMVNNFPPVPLFSSISTRRQAGDFMATVQVKPFCHIGPFCVGILIGHYLAKYRKVKLRPLMLSMCWVVAVACNTAVLFGAYQWNRGLKPPPVETAFYAATCRTVWSLGIAWIIFACATGHGGIFNELLSWKVFVPLSRLTYLTYLIHPCLMNLFSAYLRRPLHFNHYFLLHLYFAHLVTSFSTALLLTLAFESPFRAIEKAVVKRLRTWTGKHKSSAANGQEASGPTNPQRPSRSCVRSARAIFRKTLQWRGSGTTQGPSSPTNHLSSYPDEQSYVCRL